jgi:hypothetical protein
VLDAKRTLLRLIEPDGLLDQIAVRDPSTTSDLRLTPAVEQVARTRGALEPGLDPGGLPLDEIFRLFVARVVNDGEIETETRVDITRTFFQEPALDQVPEFTCSDEVFERPLELVLPQLVGRRNSDLHRELSQLGRIPITVLELPLGHCLRQPGPLGHVAPGS